MSKTPPSRPKLENQAKDLLLETGNPMDLCKQAFHKDDAALLGRVLERHPELKAMINQPLGPFDSPVITMARSRSMLDVLLAAGADINARSSWWAGGFGLLDNAPPELAAYAIERGAVVDAHAAARLGMMQRLRELVSANPDLVHARGGDGQTPLHFASTVEVAGYLLDHRADIDARDVDHESTPGQYMVGDRQEVLRFLVQRGCRTDILMAAALGDMELTRQHLDADPACVRVRVNDDFFPRTNPKSGGTIYQWTLGWHVSAHDVAKKFGHDQIFRLLMDRSAADVKLLAACWQGDEPAVRSLLGEHPSLPANLPDADRRQVAHAARNNNPLAVRLMLEAGLPVDARGQHRATPLHWAGFHGNLDMIRDILRYHPPLEIVEPDFHLPPLGWAIYGSEHGWYCRSGNYPGSVEALIKAGAKIPEGVKGTEEVKAVLRKYAARQ